MNSTVYNPVPKVSRSANGERHQKGLSLVELLVGISIGLLVILAALSTLSFTRVSSIAVTETVRMQQDATIAMEMIGRQLRQARAVNIQDAPPPGAVNTVATVAYAPYAGLNPTGAVPAVDSVSIFGINGAGTAPDSFTTSFGISAIANSSLTCLGSTTTLADAVVSTFEINGAGQLRCRPSDNANAFQAVIGNVEDLQVWYGIPNAATSNIQYLRADEVGIADWGQVASVMVCLQLASTTANVPQPPAGFLQQGCQQQNLAWDGRYRRVYRQVFALRNALVG